MDIRGYEEDEDTSSIDLGKAIDTFEALNSFDS